MRVTFLPVDRFEDGPPGEERIGDDHGEGTSALNPRGETSSRERDERLVAQVGKNAVVIGDLYLPRRPDTEQFRMHWMSGGPEARPC
jgi:hypothetical protein